jgi:hypothetical protein
MCILFLPIPNLHMIGPAAHWFQSFKHLEQFHQWEVFANVVIAEFEADTHRAKAMELLNLKHTCIVDEKRKNFEQLIYNIHLYDSSLSEMMLTSHFIMELKDEIHNMSR